MYTKLDSSRRAGFSPAYRLMRTAYHKGLNPREQVFYEYS
jgi:hypothetical protein